MRILKKGGELAHTSRGVMYCWFVPMALNSILLYLALTKFRDNNYHIKEVFLADEQKCALGNADEVLAQVGHQRILYASSQVLLIAVAMMEALYASVLRKSHNDQRLKLNSAAKNDLCPAEFTLKGNEK